MSQPYEPEYPEHDPAVSPRYPEPDSTPQPRPPDALQAGGGCGITGAPNIRYLRDAA